MHTAASCRVPQRDDPPARVVGLEAEDADRRRCFGEVLHLGDRQANPPCRQHAPELSVREGDDVAGEVAHAGNEVVCAFADARRCFAARAAVLPDVPRRVQFAILRSAAGVDVPLEQLVPLLASGDTVMGGCNSCYRDELKRSSSYCRPW